MGLSKVSDSTLFGLLIGVHPLLVVRGTGEAEAKDAAILLRKTGLENVSSSDNTAGDASLKEERKTFTKDGEKVTGFTSSVVPTLEEKIIAENGQVAATEEPRKSSQDQRPPENGRALNGDASRDVSNGDAHIDEPDKSAMVDMELYGVPANGDPQNDSYPPKNQGSEGDEEDLKGPTARSTLRRHLTAKLGSKSGTRPWVLPTPTPHVDPHGFEDPICDDFWKKTWVASAVHNVSAHRV